MNRQVTVVTDGEGETLDVIVFVRVVEAQVTGLAVVGVVPGALVEGSFHPEDGVFGGIGDRIAGECAIFV